MSSLLYAQSFERQIKINGISIWSDTVKRNQKDFQFIEESEANWVSFQPFGVVRTDSVGVHYDIDSLWETTSFEGLKSNIEIAKNLGYSVFLKPHLILDYDAPGAWVGNLKLSAKDLEIFRKSYRSYILELAILAESMEVGMFSLGTEMNQFSASNPVYWQALIDTVRSVYSGRLTYCANFDAYQKYTFWDQMDLISIDAYFTVARSENADFAECCEGWKNHVIDLEMYSKLYDKQILFAEFGYMSTDNCALRPFEKQSENVNHVAQANAYRALFEVFWHQKWFAGGFSWVWRFDNDNAMNYDNCDYTPQNKAAQGIIAIYYGNYR